MVLRARPWFKFWRPNRVFSLADPPDGDFPSSGPTLRNQLPVIGASVPFRATGLSRDELIARIAKESSGAVDKVTPTWQLPPNDNSRSEANLLGDVCPP
jgi:hypothetical protein